MKWPSRRFLDLVGVELPIIQAPMAGANGAAMASAVTRAGGVGSIPMAVGGGVSRLPDERPLNLNYFCHAERARDPHRDAAWRAALGERFTGGEEARRRPFGAADVAFLEELKPEIVSFHFGIPEILRVPPGIIVLATATSVAEAKFLEPHVDAIIAQGWEAGGHRGYFLKDGEMGTLALVPQIVDAVKIPVIAAGGISDGRGIAAAFALGADAVQIGTTYLRTAESTIKYGHRLGEDTVVTNVFSGRPARGLTNRLVEEVGPINPNAPPFPQAAADTAALRAESPLDFGPLWSGQAASLAPPFRSSEDLTHHLATDAQDVLRRLASFAP
ncbi:hypothetical protein CTAYLR_002112 [Chrysophaeum taylorii]|uniref:2-nitropropane dioxygenase n=1 Tax=Chrysophaeum taylorii TaxID=2483200 RepID=A0AAD7UN51_9STRA|nr:hypothetical protein CTAYLR_002112 [Chrysophaeum taylorii]